MGGRSPGQPGLTLGVQNILLNGQLISSSSEGQGIPATNRAFLFADGIFETIRIAKGTPIFLDEHFQRLREGLKAHRIQAPLGFTPASIANDIAALLKAEGLHEGARVRMTLSRSGAGFYTPEENGLDVVMTAQAVDSVEYVLNDKGLSTDIYPEMKCTPNHLSKFKNIASNIYVQSGLWAKENGLESALIQNDRMGIIESTASNLFLVSNGVLYTPGLDSGATAGIMRAQVINLALSSGMKVYECNLTPQNLLVADEVFLTNVVQGLQWVGSYRTKRYFNAATSELVRLLNTLVRPIYKA
jgi:branched-subunit amino acid aminotransferase/4-amino-4-deoxychorismate lyase